MNDLIMFITNGSTEFTPAVMVGLIVFCMIFIKCIIVSNSICKFNVNWWKAGLH